MTAPRPSSMRRLKNAYRGERAAVVMGGTSLLEQRFDFGRLRSSGLVTFLESKALTPGLLASGFAPDYFLMLSPEKCLSNGFHNWVFRAFLADRVVALRQRGDETVGVRRPRGLFHRFIGNLVAAVADIVANGVVE